MLIIWSFDPLSLFTPHCTSMKLSVQIRFCSQKADPLACSQTKVKRSKQNLDWCLWLSMIFHTVMEQFLFPSSIFIHVSVLSLRLSSSDPSFHNASLKSSTSTLKWARHRLSPVIIDHWVLICLVCTNPLIFDICGTFITNSYNHSALITFGALHFRMFPKRSIQSWVSCRIQRWNGYSNWGWHSQPLLTMQADLIDWIFWSQSSMLPTMHPIQNHHIRCS